MRMLLLIIAICIIVRVVKTKTNNVKLKKEEASKQNETSALGQPTQEFYHPFGGTRQKYFDLRQNEMLMKRFPSMVHWEYKDLRGGYYPFSQQENTVTVFFDDGKSKNFTFKSVEIWGERVDEEEAPAPSQTPAQLWILNNTAYIDGKVKKAKKAKYLSVPIKVDEPEEVRKEIAKELMRNTNYFVTCSNDGIVVDFRGTIDPDEVPDDFPE